MKPKYMLDTNICIYLMKHQPPEVRERFAACFVGDVVISALTLAELEFGIARLSPASQAANWTRLNASDCLTRPRRLSCRSTGGLRLRALSKIAW